MNQNTIYAKTGKQRSMSYIWAPLRHTELMVQPTQLYILYD